MMMMMMILIRSRPLTSVEQYALGPARVVVQVAGHVKHLRQNMHQEGRGVRGVML